MASFTQLFEKLYLAASSVSPWYAAVAVIALSNLKVLPFGWHVSWTVAWSLEPIAWY